MSRLGILCIVGIPAGEEQMDGRIALLITKAEYHITEQRYKEAEECIAAAEQIEPFNRSVGMLRELLGTLQKSNPRKSLFFRFFPKTVERNPAGSNVQEPLSPHELKKRIRSLTGSADHYLSRGAVENAYESLTRARQLDPSHPDVIACEKRVLPLWRKLRGDLPEDSGATLALPSPNRKVQSSLYDRLKSGTLLS